MLLGVWVSEPILDRVDEISKRGCRGSLKPEWSSSRVEAPRCRGQRVPATGGESRTLQEIGDRSADRNRKGVIAGKIQINGRQVAMPLVEALEGNIEKIGW